MKEGLAATLRLGADPTAMPIVSQLVDNFCMHYPLANVRVEELPSTEIIQRLENFALDAGLTYLDPDPPAGTRAIEICQERYILLTPENLAPSGDTTTWAEAVTRPLCALNRMTRTRRILEKAALTEGVHLDPIIEVDSVPALYAQVASGWSGIVSHKWLDKFDIPSGVRAVALPAASAPPIGILTRDDQKVSLAAEAFLSNLDPSAVTAGDQKLRFPGLAGHAS